MRSTMQKQNFKVILIGAGIFFTCMITSSLFLSNHQSRDAEFVKSLLDRNSRETKPENSIGPLDPEFWKTVKLDAKIPDKIKELKKSVKINTNYVNIMSVNTFYREASIPTEAEHSGEVVILLHGAAFTSRTWENLTTIQYLAAMGHKVYAIDLPGYGETRSKVQLNDKKEFLSKLIKELTHVPPVVLSPSMSGSFSIPLLLSKDNNLSGFIAVAPVQTSDVLAQGSSVKVPTLIIYGEKDKSIGIKSQKDLLAIPLSRSVMIPNAGHPAYLDDPDMFHTLLYNYIPQVTLHKLAKE